MASKASKPILYIGILLLLVGIVVRKMSSYHLMGLVMILAGVGLKTFYIIAAIRSGLYKPGKELWLLFVGLALFLSGLYLRDTDFFVDARLMIVIGLVLKVLFIIRFIQMVRETRKNSQPRGVPGGD